MGHSYGGYCTLALLTKRETGSHAQRKLGASDLQATSGRLRRPSGTQLEWRVAVRDEKKCVAGHATVPAKDAFNEREQVSRVTTSEEDREPGSGFSRINDAPLVSVPTLQSVSDSDGRCAVPKK